MLAIETNAAPCVLMRLRLAVGIAVSYVMGMAKRMKIKLFFEDADLLDLNAIAQEVPIRRNWLIEKVVVDWLSSRRVFADRRRSWAAAKAMKAAAFREMIVLNWQKFKRKEGARATKRLATEKFLARLRWGKNVKLCRATLYNWQKRYSARGIEGLIDERGIDYTERRTPFLFFQALKREMILSPGTANFNKCYKKICEAAERTGSPNKSRRVCRKFIRS
jgi:hypothetical protein